VDSAQSGSLAAWSTGRVVLSGTHSPPLHFSRSVATIARSGLDGLAVRLVRAGDFSGTADGKYFSANAGDVLILDLLNNCKFTTAPLGDVTL
jgi:hypothetical protein